jgi:hypothetical protein
MEEAEELARETCNLMLEAFGAKVMHYSLLMN